MQCQFAQELFSDHISDSLDRAQKVSLSNHLVGCKDCREQVAGLRDLWASLDTLPVVETPKFFHENIMDRIAMEAAKEQEAQQSVKSAGWDWRSLFRARSLAFGAAALALLLGGLSATQTQQSSLNPLAGISRWFAKPAPLAPLALQKLQGAWVPGGENGEGSVTVTLRAVPLINGEKNIMTYRVMQAGNVAPLKSGLAVSDRDVTVSIPLAAPPAPDSLSVTLSDLNTSRASAPQPLAIPAP